MFKPQSIGNWFLVNVSVAVLLSSRGVMAQDSVLRKNFEAIYAKRDQALRLKDAASINALLAEGFTSKEADGKLKNRAQVVAETNAVIAAMEEVTIADTKVESVRQGNNQNEAIVESSDALKTTLKLADGQLHLFEGRGKSRDTWVRTAAGWRLKYHEVLETGGSVDGKPVQQPNGKDESQAKANGDTPRPIATEVQAAANAPVEFVNWTDPVEAKFNMNSFTVEVPRGWQVTGGVNWTGPIDSQRFIRAKSPDGKMLIFIGDPNLLPRQVPYQFTGREGTTFTSPSGGPALVQRYLTGSQFAKQHVMLGRPCPNIRWVKEENLPDLAGSIAKWLEPQARPFKVDLKVSAGEAGFVCDGAQGYVLGATFLGSSRSTPIQDWGIFMVAGFVTSDPMQSMQARYIMEHMLGTMKLNSQWDQANEELIKRMTGVVISGRNAAFELQSNARQSASNDLSRLNHPNLGVGPGPNPISRSNGNTHVCDGIGRCATVSNTSGPVFIDHSGNVREGPGSGGPPDNSGVWSRLYPWTWLGIRR